MCSFRKYKCIFIEALVIKRGIKRGIKRTSLYLNQFIVFLFTEICLYIKQYFYTWNMEYYWGIINFIL